MGWQEPTLRSVWMIPVLRVRTRWYRAFWQQALRKRGVVSFFVENKPSMGISQVPAMLAEF